MELLVVIAIILTLAGIAMTVVNGVMEKSKVTTARGPGPYVPARNGRGAAARS